MGAHPNSTQAHEDEKPLHRVFITKKMEVCSYPVSQGLYEYIMGHNPSHYKGINRPVETVSWVDAILFCNRLSEREGLQPTYLIPEGLESSVLRCDHLEEEALSQEVTWDQDASGYSLLTEAEWEFCAKAGEEFLFSGSNNIEDVAWFWRNSQNQTQSLGQKDPNMWGLYDMSGNVDEWVFDEFMDTAYTSTDRTDPVVNLIVGFGFVIRGGNHQQFASGIRLSSRRYAEGHKRIDEIGFRIRRYTK